MPPPSLPRRRRGRARRRGPSREDPNSAATTSRSAHAPRRALLSSQSHLTAAAHSFSSQPRHLSSGTWQRTAELRATSTAATRRAASLAPRCIAIGGPARCSAHSLPRFPLCGPSLPAACIPFAAICMFEIATRFALAAAFSEHIILSLPRNRNVLARMAYSTVILVHIAETGWSMWRELDMATLPSTAHGRIYVYLPRFVSLCVTMGAFQVKNLFDTIIYGDGPEFIAHHLVCIFVAWGAISGDFLHLYGIFFFGFSEVCRASYLSSTRGPQALATSAISLCAHTCAHLLALPMHTPRTRRPVQQLSRSLLASTIASVSQSLESCTLSPRSPSG